MKINEMNISTISAIFMNTHKFKVGDIVIIEETDYNLNMYPRDVGKIGTILNIFKNGLANVKTKDRTIGIYLARLKHYQDNDLINF